MVERKVEVEIEGYRTLDVARDVEIDGDVLALRDPSTGELLRDAQGTLLTVGRGQIG